MAARKSNGWLLKIGKLWPPPPTSAAISSIALRGRRRIRGARSGISLPFRNKLGSRSSINSHRDEPERWRHANRPNLIRNSNEESSRPLRASSSAAAVPLDLIEFYWPGALANANTMARISPAGSEPQLEFDFGAWTRTKTGSCERGPDLIVAALRVGLPARRQRPMQLALARSGQIRSPPVNKLAAKFVCPFARRR